MVSGNFIKGWSTIQATVALSSGEAELYALIKGKGAAQGLGIMAMAEAAFKFVEEGLAPGGNFIAKVLQGGAEEALLAKMKQRFATVRHAKPPASRTDPPTPLPDAPANMPAVPAVPLDDCPELSWMVPTESPEFEPDRP